MFTKILYPTDFSIPAQKALDYVKHLKGAGTQEVTVLHVIDRRGLDDLARFSKRDIHDIEKELEKKATAKIKPIAEELTETGFTVNTMITQGGPCVEIMRVADEEDASLIIVGSRGTGNIEDMVLGSVSYKLIKRSRKPIMIIKR